MLGLVKNMTKANEYLPGEVDLHPQEEIVDPEFLNNNCKSK